MAGAFRQNAEHDLSHAGVWLTFRPHPWAAGDVAGVPPDTGNRPAGHRSRHHRRGGCEPTA
jgi:hypothetical protein